jgi:ADP-heptose:LPS heptosyltransferase
MIKKKILIFKNDRVGDLYHCLNQLVKILDKRNENIIYLSNFNKNFSFLFKGLAKIKISNYRLSFIDKIKIFFDLLHNKYDYIFILSPKNFLFYLPLFFRKPIYFAIFIDEKKKIRPLNFIRNKFNFYVINNRCSLKHKKSINNLNENLVNKFLEINSLSIENNFIESKSKEKSDYIHVHYKKNLYKKHNWKIEDFFYLVDNLQSEKKIYITNDINETEDNKKIISKYKDNNKIKYFENISGEELHNLIFHSDAVISPHGTMTVIAAYNNVNVIDLFDDNISLISFKEYKLRPLNRNYNFLILKDVKYKNLIISKINNYLNI